MYFDGADHLHILEWTPDQPYTECWKCKVPMCRYEEKRYIECQ